MCVFVLQVVWIPTAHLGVHSVHNFIDRILGPVKRSMYLQFSLNIQQTERKQNVFFCFFSFFFKPQTYHSYAPRAGLTWPPGTVKVPAHLCRDRYWNTPLNLSAMDDAEFGSGALFPRFESYLLTFGEFHFTVSVELPEINDTVGASSFYCLYLCGVLFR